MRRVPDEVDDHVESWIRRRKAFGTEVDPQIHLVVDVRIEQLSRVVDELLFQRVDSSGTATSSTSKPSVFSR